MRFDGSTGFAPQPADPEPGYPFIPNRSSSGGTARNNRTATVRCSCGAIEKTSCAQWFNPGGDGSNHCAQEVFSIAPHEHRTVAVRLLRAVPPELDLFGMNGYPGSGSAGWGAKPVDPSNLIQVIVFLDHPTEDHVVEISSLRGQ